MSNAIGSSWERDLVNTIDELDHGVMRIPASGAGTDHDLPDVFAGVDGESYAFEAKYSSGKPIYLTGEEIEALFRFAEKFGATPLVAIRYHVEHGDPPYGNGNDCGWRFLHLGQLYQTDGGNYRVKKQKAYDDGLRLDDL